MEEKIDLNEFDILGIINLKEIQGIEKYVTPVIKEGKIVNYLSRSKEYYNVKSMTELAIEREELAQLLTKKSSKRNFVIIENMLNCSGKVYFKKFEQYISSKKNEQEALQLSQAEECLIEDVKNILAVLGKQGVIDIDRRKRLPGGMENSERRSIEMDNKAILYIFAQSLKIKRPSENIEVLTPGYGSIYIGPFLNAMHGYNFTNTLKSKYLEETKSSQGIPIETLMSSTRPFEDEKTILLLDDNVGTGQTIEELKRSLQENGVKNTIISGAVQYNWRNYYRVSVGEKTDIPRPNIEKFDIVTPINYAGHKLYKHAIDLLLSSGSEYIEYLKSKSYRKSEYSDIKGALIRGLTCSQKTGLRLADEIDEYIMPDGLTEKEREILPQYQNSSAQITNPIAKKITNRIIKIIKSLNVSKLPENTGEMR